MLNKSIFGFIHNRIQHKNGSGYRLRGFVLYAQPCCGNILMHFHNRVKKKLVFRALLQALENFLEQHVICFFNLKD